MKRKILVTLLAFCLIASLCVVGAAAEGPDAEKVVQYNGQAYETISEVVASIHELAGDARMEEHVITLTDNYTGGGFAVGYNTISGGTTGEENPVNITLDLGGFTYTVTGPTVGSAGTETNGFQFLQGSIVSIKNGTIKSELSKILFQNYSKLTMEDVDVVATNASYVASNNCGEFNFLGSSSITAGEGKVAFDVCDFSSYPGVVVTIDTTGTITGEVEISKSGNKENNGELNIINGTINGSFDVQITDENIEITGGTFTDKDAAREYFPTNSALTFDENGKVVTDDKTAVAEVNNVPYKTLQAAIDAAEDNDTVTLVANVNEDITAGTPLKVEKDITIEGNGKTISLKLANSTDSNGRDKILQVKGENAKLTLNNVKLDINGFVNTANENRACGDAIDLYLGGDLEANNSIIAIDNVAAAFVIQTEGETIELNNTTVTADNVRGNGSQGGEWTVNDSRISFTNCGSHGLSVETADITNSTITVDGAGLCAVYGKVLNFGANTTVNVTNSGPATPFENWNKTETYYGAVQIKELPGCSLTVESSAIINVSGTNNTVYLPAGAELVNNGTINATVKVPADSDMNVVLFMADGRQYDVQVVNDGDSVRMPTLEKSGYTFTGWRVNNSNTIVKGGESYPITANTTFTAVWNMIMIPDTYDIAVDQPAHGTVDVSLSNASQGSVITVTATPDEGYELVYITVDGEPISGNSFVMPDHAVEVSALFAEIGKEVNFVDVSRADWFYDYVQYVAQNGLMEGTTRTAFEPNASMTRAMFWTVLARIDGETITGDAWKTLAQTWAVESGISDGTNADALITREQMVTMLYRYAGSPVAGGMAISEFTDGASVSGYATDAVTWALSEGILTGMGDGILAPQGTATRAQAAAMLMRFVEA